MTNFYGLKQYYYYKIVAKFRDILNFDQSFFLSLS